MRRLQPSSGLEAAPDIMLLTMAGLMVAIVWLVSQAHETSLPPIDLPQSEAATLGADRSSSVHVTLRPGAQGELEVYIEDDPVPGGLEGLARALEARSSASVTLRADAGTRWEHALQAMTAAAGLSLPVSVAAER
jgi:biopolymer transport protein ExbD